MFNRIFRFEYLILALLVNGGVVFVINVNAGVGEALASSVTQMLLSSVLAGFTAAICIRAATHANWRDAYLWGSLYMALGVSALAAIVHYGVGTVDFWPTIWWTFLVNFTSGAFVVRLTRRGFTIASLPKYIRAEIVSFKKLWMNRRNGS